MNKNIDIENIELKWLFVIILTTIYYRHGQVKNRTHKFGEAKNGTTRKSWGVKNELLINADKY